MGLGGMAVTVRPEGAGRSPGRVRMAFDVARMCRDWLVVLTIVAAFSSATSAQDMGLVPLLDGERFDSSSLLNTWGGAISPQSGVTFSREGSVVHSGIGAYQFNLGSVANGDFRFVQTFSSGSARESQLSARPRSHAISIAQRLRSQRQRQSAHVFGRA